MQKLPLISLVIDKKCIVPDSVKGVVDNSRFYLSKSKSTNTTLIANSKNVLGYVDESNQFKIIIPGRRSKSTGWSKIILSGEMKDNELVANVIIEPALFGIGKRTCAETLEDIKRLLKEEIKTLNNHNSQEPSL